MKKTNIILSFVICILLYGCTDLSETVYTGVAMNDFFKNEKELVANAGRAYTKLQGYNSEQSLWTLLLQASDECAVCYGRNRLGYHQCKLFPHGG